ncbi:MAG: hypothetical protein JWO38_8144 [Gemmataceae bacterium]|nr:hypothetical protein [Gemmataceae bacterium]
MRRATGLGAGLVIGLAVLAGCGQEKQLPTDGQIPTEKEGPRAAPVPTKSERAAEDLVARCVKAATDGHPERLERAKAHAQSAKGTWRWEANNLAPAARHIQAVWPDRTRVTLDFLTGNIKQTQIGLRRTDLWMINLLDTGPVDYTSANLKQEGEIAAVDLIGELWLPMLVPLVDPPTIVFGAEKEKLGIQSADVFRVSVQGCPVFKVWLDEPTGLPKLITYTHAENNATILKQVALGGHKPFAGVLLPTELEFSRNGIPVQKWTITAWDFVDKIDDATFDRPPEKK